MSDENISLYKFSWKYFDKYTEANVENFDVEIKEGKLM